MLQADAQRNHESDYKVALKAEGPEDAGSFFRHGHDARGVLADDAGEHLVESGEYQDGQRYHPPKVLRPVHLEIMAHAGDGYLRPDSRPEQAVDCQQMFGLDLHSAKLVNNSGTAARLYHGTET